jgi:hypothetical protein
MMTKEQELRTALEAYVKAQGRMLDRWAEGDSAVKADLWKALHECEEAGRKALATPRRIPCERENAQLRDHLARVLQTTGKKLRANDGAERKSRCPKSSAPMRLPSCRGRRSDGKGNLPLV